VKMGSNRGSVRVGVKRKEMERKRKRERLLEKMEIGMNSKNTHCNQNIITIDTHVLLV
jgi:hypothetical protein